MEDKATDSGQTELRQERRAGGGEWRFYVPIAVAVVLAAYVLFWRGLVIHETIAAYLPLLLPLAVTVLSIATRAADIRNLEAVLKISNDIAIGIISFDIWALSASRSDPAGRILVNPKAMIRGEFAIPFLLFGLIFAVGCLVLTSYSFKQERTKQRWLIVGFVTSCLVYIMPFGVLEPVSALGPPGLRTAEIRQYTVVIPYQDPGIISYAPAFLGERLFVRLEKNVEAADPSAAKAAALQRFLASSDSNRIKSKGKGRSNSESGEKVIIRQAEVLVVERLYVPGTAGSGTSPSFSLERTAHGTPVSAAAQPAR